MIPPFITRVGKVAAPAYSIYGRQPEKHLNLTPAPGMLSWYYIILQKLSFKKVLANGRNREIFFISRTLIWPNFLNVSVRESFTLYNYLFKKLIPFVNMYKISQHERFFLEYVRVILKHESFLINYALL